MITRTLLRFTLLALVFTLILVAPIVRTLSASPAQDTSDSTVFLPIVPQSERADPQFINSFGGYSEFFHVQDHFAYVGQGNQLLAVDISDPAAPILRSQVALPGAPISLALVDGYIYVGISNNIAIISAANPNELILTDIIPVKGKAFCSHQANTLLYVCTPSELLIYDLAVPGSLRLRSQVSGYPGQITVVGDLVYTASNILDVSDPDHPVLLSSFDWSYPSIVDGAFAVFASSGCGRYGCGGTLVVFDVRDPTNPTITTNQQWHEYIRAVLLEGDLLYVGTDYKLSIFQINQTGDLNLISETPLFHSLSHLHKEGNLLYIVNNAYNMNLARLSVLDVGNPVQPQTLRNYDLEERLVLDVQIIQTRAYLLTTDPSTGGYLPFPQSFYIYMIDLEQPSTPVLLGEFPMPPGAITSVQGGLGYLVADGGLYIYDLSNPRISPPLLSDYNASGNCGLQPPLYVVEHIAYVLFGCQPGHVLALDLSDPTMPERVNEFGLDETSHLLVQNQYAYLGRDVYVTPPYHAVAEIDIMDISNPQNTQTLSRYRASTHSPETIASINVLAFDNERLFLGLYGGMEIVDVSQPISPTYLGTYTQPITYPVTAIAISGDIALVGVVIDEAHPDEAYQVDLVDIQDPANPIQVGTYPVNEWISAIQIVGDQAYVATGLGLFVLDISNPYEPVLLYRYPVYAWDIWLADDGYLYIAGRDNGVMLFEPIHNQFPRE